jgi:hypothetical protein
MTYPLRNLKTRDPNDFAIALLDSWATVGDVLAFYQERIANEGYLRTATELRSILELARLIGYALRPGVASTVYLAYTLNEDKSVTPPRPTATTISKGSRVQSVPGPGELPQSFETSDELDARSEWNNLQPRLTRPQGIKSIVSNGLYLKGIVTNLKPNDPLLIRASHPKLYRVMEVTLDPPTDRTKVTVQAWLPPEVAAPEKVIAHARPLADAARQIVERFSDTKKARVSPSNRSTKEVLSYLNALEGKLKAEASEAELKAFVNETLPKLKDVHRVALEGGFTRVEPWVGRLVTDLEAAVRREPDATPRVSASNLPAAAPGIEKAGSTLGITSLPDVLTSLIKPPSIPPPNSQQLPRSAEQTFASKTDITAQILTKFRPEVTSVLYRAWENIPVTPEPAIEVYALRTKASVFGNNAPRPPSETFSIRAFLDPAAVESATITIERHMIELVPLSSKTFDFPKAEEKITVSISHEGHDGQKTVFTFQNRQVEITIPSDPKSNVIAESKDPTTTTEIQITTVQITPLPIFVGGKISYELTLAEEAEEADVVWLDAPYEQILPNSWIVLERPNSASSAEKRLVISQAKEVTQASRADYGISAKITRIRLTEDWIDPKNDKFPVIRGTTVFAQSEELSLAEAPIEEPVSGAEIELSRLYDGLESGRWLIVSGERTDIIPDYQTKGSGVMAAADAGSQQSATQVKGVPASELVMLAGVTQDVETLENGKTNQPGDKTHTFLTVAEKGLAYRYKRDTVKIYGNVVKATHGETRNETLGGGDGSKGFQQFTLKQPPLTFVSAPNPAGVDSTLVVRVNDVQWHETESLAGLLPTDRKFITRTDDEGKTTVIFGNGKQGARLPTGQGNVTAVYRNAIGKPGNVKAGRISLLVTQPLSVKEVINPLPATGGADKENVDQARDNAPLAVMALDRLLSTQDYADFARTFAGIGKAGAARLSDGRRQLVYVTIAGADDIPIEKHSDLYTNLELALREFGDPYQPIQVELRKLKLLVIQAKVRVLPDYVWEKVEPKARAALLDKFSFARRDFGQDVFLSEVISAIQAVEGVQFVDVDKFDGIDEQQVIGGLATKDTKSLADQIGLQPRVRVELAHVDVTASEPEGRIQPAELAYFSPDIPDTIILSENH